MKSSFSFHHSGSGFCSRRRFLAAAGGLIVFPGILRPAEATAHSGAGWTRWTGPGGRYRPRVHAAFVRRKGDYGMRWPGAIYDGEAARRDYQEKLLETARALGIEVQLRPEPIYSLAETAEWLAQVQAARPDGLLVMLLDRQEHAWPTANQAIETGIPTIIFAPIGAAFTTNTDRPAREPGVFICSTDDFRQVVYGLKMIRAGAKLREMRFIVLRGKERLDETLEPFGTRLRYLPAQTFLDEYHLTPLDDVVRRMASEYRRAATGMAGPTEEDLQNGIKSYRVARRILEREDGDGITMDCLGALGHTRVSLPCIAWSRLLDEGIPAACEADLGAAVTHALVQLLFDRPGFQQDPVPETARDCLIGAHCTCPTRLNGFDSAPEPYDITHHHGKRDAVPRPRWRLGQPVTVADVIMPPGSSGAGAGGGLPQMVISTGKVVDNVSVPPSGGCVVSVMVKLDTEADLLTYPGFHQIFFYGDFKKELLAYCRLYRLEPIVA